MPLSVSGCGETSIQNGFLKCEKAVTAKSDDAAALAKDKETTEESALEATIKELAQKDAAKDVYMGSEYQQFHRKYVSEVSPDRAAYIAKAKAKAKHRYNIKQAVDSLLDLLFHTPEKEKQYVSDDDVSEVFDDDGELIAGHSNMDGLWFPLPTAAENARDMKLTFMYYDAYHDARQAMKAGGTTDTGAVLDIQA